jgi:hypothetical protein
MFKLALKIWSGLFLLATLGAIVGLISLVYQVVKMDQSIPIVTSASTQTWSPPASDLDISNLPAPKN